MKMTDEILDENRTNASAAMRSDAPPSPDHNNDTQDLEKIAVVMRDMLLKKLREVPTQHTLTIALNAPIHTNNHTTLYQWILDFLLRSQPVDTANLSAAMQEVTDALRATLNRATQTGLYCYVDDSAFIDETYFS